MRYLNEFNVIKHHPLKSMFYNLRLTILANISKMKEPISTLHNRISKLQITDKLKKKYKTI